MNIDLNEYRKQIASLKEIYNEDLGVLKKLRADKASKEADISQYNKEKETLGIKKTLLKDACKEARKNAKDVLQNMSTRGLQSILGDNVSLVINLDEDKAIPEAEFIVRTEYANNYVVENDPADGDGGGIADVVSLSNMFSMNYLTGKKNVAPIFFDEATKHVSGGNSEPVAKFLYEISHYFNKQTFMITHDKFLANMGDKAYLFELDPTGKTRASSL